MRKRVEGNRETRNSKKKKRGRPEVRTYPVLSKEEGKLVRATISEGRN